MYLKGLELAGFKSFAKKSELFFNAPISSIVGPNGSGKSNLAEAFRFVLGEQSIKSLRGKKGEDLIFNGSGDTPRANRATVKVIFDNSRRFLNLDFDEVSIERTVHRDGVNEYYINGSQVRLKDILELLAGAHIGSSGYHIISQGEADRILSAPIKERKAMIEDALGLRVYQYKKQESARKLEKTEENIAHVESLRKEIAPHIKFLKKQVEKVEKALEMKEKLKTMYIEYFKKEDSYIRVKKADLSAKISPLKKQLEVLHKELEQAKKVLENSKEANQKGALVVSMEEKISATRTLRNSLSLELGRIEGQVASEERILIKQKEIEDNDAHKMVSLKDIENVALAVDRDIASLENEQDISRIKSVLRAIKDSLFDFISRNKTLTNNTLREETQAEINRLEAKKQELLLQIEKANTEESILNNNYIALKNDIEKEKDSNRDAEKAVFRIMAEENSIVSEIHTLDAQGEILVREEVDFKRELVEAVTLVGRDVLDFANFQLKDDLGAVVTEDVIASSPRDKQIDLRRDIEKIQIRIEEAGLGGNTNDIVREYTEASERDTFLAKELEDLAKSAKGLQDLIVDLENKIDIEFKVGIQKINKQFQEFFSLMFGGGEAGLVVVKESKKKKSDTDLILEDGELDDMENDVVEEGIDISVSLPRKKVKGLVMLSGGERALTSIALLFAVSQVNPPPFIILDETDAALDEANSKKYGDMIENLSKYSQLILITHNRETMSRAGIIYGVTMGQGGISKLLSISFDDAVTVAK